MRVSTRAIPPPTRRHAVTVVTSVPLSAAPRTAGRYRGQRTLLAFLGRGGRKKGHAFARRLGGASNVVLRRPTKGTIAPRLRGISEKFGGDRHSSSGPERARRARNPSRRCTIAPRCSGLSLSTYAERTVPDHKFSRGRLYGNVRMKAFSASFREKPALLLFSGRENSTRCTDSLREKFH